MEALGSYTPSPPQTHTMSLRDRKKRIDNLLKMLKSAEPPIQELKFRAVASFNLGVSTTKINEYLEMLHQMEVFRYDEGVMIVNE